MGVQGLTTYVERNRHFLHSLRVRNTRLVVDGCSLYYRLYFTSGLDQRHGGDYDSFAGVVRQFFETLSRCNVWPFVVLDGGMDHTDKKFQTLKERLQSKIKEASTLSRDGGGSVLPLFTREVFLKVLAGLRVPVVQCVSEADWEIAALANQWGCPVLTNDSDFYIFDLKGGYLPMAHFQWNNLSMCGRTSEWYIPASRFSVDAFCAHFRHMNKELLPLFAVIAGNDYISLPATERLFGHIQHRDVGRRGRTYCQIESLLHWLAGFNGPEQALDEAAGLLGGRRRGAVRAQLSSRMHDYHLSESHVAVFFTGGSPAFALPDPLGSLPRWVLRALSEARLSPTVIDTLVLQRVLLVVQVEDCRLPSSHCASVPLRQVLYGLLLDWKQRRGQGRRSEARGWGQVQQGPCGQGYFVEEFDRHNLDLRRSAVQAALPHLIRQLPLEKMHEVSLPLRRQLLLDALGVDLSVAHAAPPSLSLPICVTVYWLRVCSPRPSLQHLQALLLGLLYGELCRIQATERGPLAECLAVRAVYLRLGQHRVAPGERDGLDLDSAHIYSQWQSCMWTSFHLNRLLCYPLPEPDCTWLYSGTLVHCMVRDLRGGTRPLDDLMAGAPFPGQLYSDLLGAVLSVVGPAFFASSSSSKKKKRRGRRRPRPETGGQLPPDVVNRFGLLEVNDDDE